jgi:hypothetical protein
MPIESSAVISVHPDWPAQTPQGSGSAGSKGLAVWVPGASRSPITSNDGLGVALGAGLADEGFALVAAVDGAFDLASDGLVVVVQPIARPAQMSRHMTKRT